MRPARARHAADRSAPTRTCPPARACASCAAAIIAPRSTLAAAAARPVAALRLAARGVPGRGRQPGRDSGRSRGRARDRRSSTRAGRTSCAASKRAAGAWHRRSRGRALRQARAAGAGDRPRARAQSVGLHLLRHPDLSDRRATRSRSIDPGPDLPEHVDALEQAIGGRPVAAIMCTHTHRDHSPAARPLAERDRSADHRLRAAGAGNGRPARRRRVRRRLSRPTGCSRTARRSRSTASR